jgi:hypothetical protein
MAWQQAAIAAFKKAATSDATRKGVASAGKMAAGALGKAGVTRGRALTSKRGYKRLAVDLAHQVGGQYSEGTIVDGERRYVVWKDGRPIEAFPGFDGDLSSRHELQSIPASLLRTPRAATPTSEPGRDGTGDDGVPMNGSGVSSRVDVATPATKGSQLQTQLWVNSRTIALSNALRSLFPTLSDAEIEWRSPLAEDGFTEYQDTAFLKRVDLGAHVSDLENFWPRRGPVWDGLAVTNVDGETGVILVEGKSYPDELFGSGCQASPKSRERIEAAFGRTQEWLGIEPDPARWCGRLYQTANRLAHLYWLREALGVQAWFVHLLFTGDPHKPTTEAAWKKAMAAADAELGLKGPVDGMGHLVLEAGAREELAGQA